MQGKTGRKSSKKTVLCDFLKGHFASPFRDLAYDVPVTLLK